MSEYIAFYGTLTSSNNTAVHVVINQSLYFISECIIPGLLYRKKRYPALKAGTGKVKGELYQVLKPEALPILDKYEAIDNENSSLPGFTRKRVSLIEPRVTAWVYYYDGPVERSALIKSGRWK